MALAALAGASTLLACRAAHDPAPSPDAIAAFHGGEVTLSMVEARLPSTVTPPCLPVRRARGSASLDQLVPCYRDIARTLALHQLVAAETDDLDDALRDLGEPYKALRDAAYLQRFRAAVRADLEASDEEIAAYFEAHRDDFRQPARLSLSNLFLRHDDPERPQDTLALLADLRLQYQAGRPFDQLAREHSQSETRLRGGLVGVVTEGEMPERLDRVAFALDDGGVSEPVLVRGGAVLLHVRNLVPATAPDLATARAQVRRRLLAEKLRRAEEEEISGFEPPAGAVMLSAAALIETLDEALDAGDDERVILAVGDRSLTTGQLRESAELATDRSTADLDDAARERLLASYDEARHSQLLAEHLIASADARTRAEAEAEIRQQALILLTDRVIRQDMETAADSDPERLRRYFEEHRAHYQSALRFDLEVWDLPFGDDPPEQLKRMEELQRQLVAGSLDLQAAAERLGGDLRELGWRTFDELGEDVPNKAREYLLAGDGSFSVPYQQDDALHVIHVRTRRDPGPVDYQEVATQVRRDYVERFEQQLFREAADRRLDAAGFRFDETKLRDLLTTGATGDT